MLSSALLASGQAEASDSYPEDLQARIPTPCPPPCTTCHRDAAGGFGTAIKPFAEAMKKNGLLPESPSTVKPALDALEAAKIDSDSDGTPDIEELRNGTDPNVAGAASICGEEPSHGCGASLVPGASARSDAGWLVVLGVTSAAALRTRRRRPKSSC